MRAFLGYRPQTGGFEGYVVLVAAEPTTCSRLNLALMTILTNAFEANKGKGQIRLSTNENATSVVIAIADEGPGISPSDGQRLFEIRIDSSTKRVKAGFGLPAAYSLIKEHGGDIVVEPAGDSGACFRITLPRAGRGALRQPLGGACSL